MRIWNRYLLALLSKTFFFILVVIFLMYTLLDLSMNGIRYLSQGNSVEIAKYYLYSFSNYHFFFFPLTLLFSSLKVFLDLNRHHELVALQMAGLSQKKLLTPFFAFATFLVIASYAHQEWMAPISQMNASSFRYSHAKHKKKNLPHIYNIALQDHSEIIYQNFEKDQLFDVFWIRNNKDLWHMKYLKLHPSVGLFADHFQRNGNGEIEKTESFTEISLPQIAIDPTMKLENFLPLEQRSLSTLFLQAIRNHSERKNILCYLQNVLASPLLSYLILLAISPFMFRFSRSKNALIITATSLFGFIAFRTVMDGMYILAENQVIPSSIAIWTPIAFFFCLFLPRFVRS
jgi:lipopolysaccharide export LptBFGC system permease protein LptF